MHLFLYICLLYDDLNFRFGQWLNWLCIGFLLLIKWAVLWSMLPNMFVIMRTNVVSLGLKKMDSIELGLLLVENSYEATIGVCVGVYVYLQGSLESSLYVDGFAGLISP